MKKIRILIDLLILLQILDGGLTYIGFNIGIGEGNPIAVKLINSLGVIPMLLILKGTAISVLFFVRNKLKTKSTLILSSLMIVNFVYLSVVSIWVYTLLNI